jgi:hypothetical protein
MKLLQLLRSDTKLVASPVSKPSKSDNDMAERIDSLQTDIVQMLEKNFNRFDKTLQEMTNGMRTMQTEVNMIKQKVDID